MRFQVDVKALDFVDEHGRRWNEEQFQIRLLVHEVRRYLEVLVAGARVLALVGLQLLVELVESIRGEQPERAGGGLARAGAPQAE